MNPTNLFESGTEDDPGFWNGANLAFCKFLDGAKHDREEVDEGTLIVVAGFPEVLIKECPSYTNSHIKAFEVAERYLANKIHELGFADILRLIPMKIVSANSTHYIIMPNLIGATWINKLPAGNVLFQRCANFYYEIAMSGMNPHPSFFYDLNTYNLLVMPDGATVYIIDYVKKLNLFEI